MSDKMTEDDIEKLEIKIGRMNALIKNCRLDIASPFSIGVTRSLEILYRKNLISRKDYDRLNGDINDAVNGSYHCACMHPMAIFA